MAITINMAGRTINEVMPELKEKLKQKLGFTEKDEKPKEEFVAETEEVVKTVHEPVNPEIVELSLEEKKAILKNNYTVVELKKMAKVKGLSGYSKLNEDELVNLLVVE